MWYSSVLLFLKYTCIVNLTAGTCPFVDSWYSLRKGIWRSISYKRHVPRQVCIENRRRERGSQKAQRRLTAERKREDEGDDDEDLKHLTNWVFKTLLVSKNGNLVMLYIKLNHLKNVFGRVCSTYPFCLKKSGRNFRTGAKQTLLGSSLKNGARMFFRKPVQTRLLIFRAG